MNKNNNERLNRDLAIQLVVLANSIVWGTLTAFVNAWNKFTALVTKAQAVVANSEKDITGNAVNKMLARSAMADTAMLVKGAVQAYAKTIADMALFESVNFSRSMVMYGMANVGLSRAQVIHDVANGVVGSLSTFGVTPLTLTAYGTLLSNYSALISAPANAIASRKMYNAEIETYLDQADDALKNQVAKLMENFKVSAPDFYAQFFNDLRLIHGATHFTEISALCMDNTNAPLEGVTMVITNGVRTYSAVSDFTGVADHKSMEPGDYSVTFSKTGYHDHELSVHIGLSEEENFDVNMVPVAPPPVI